MKCLTIACLAAGSFASTSLVACGSAESDKRAIEADAEILARVLASDEAQGILREVDEAVDERRPVRAAELLELGAIPAVEAQRAEAEGATPSTPEGRAWRDALVSAYREREDALRSYRAALARGEVVDERLADAIAMQADAERRLVEVHDAVLERRAVRPIKKARRR